MLVQKSRVWCPISEKKWILGITDFFTDVEAYVNIVDKEVCIVRIVLCIDPVTHDVCLSMSICLAVHKEIWSAAKISSLQVIARKS